MYLCIKYYLIGFSKKEAATILVASILLLAALNILGPIMHAMRSYVYIGQLQSATEIRLDSAKKENFLVERLNIHGNHVLIKDREDYVAELDWVALRSIFEKFLGFTSAYRVYPNAVSKIVGNELGFSEGISSTGFPRNWILYHYESGMLAVLIFNFVLGYITTFLYKMIYQKKSIIFIYLWFPLMFGTMFSAQDAFPSAFIFQRALTLYSIGSVLGLFIFIIGLRSLRKAATR